MPKLSRMRFLVATAAVALLCAPPPAAAGSLDSEIDAMFNNLGAMGNITTPGAFRGQTYNTYTGGSFYMRAPNRTYSLASMAWPTAKGGCGGIDLFGGSFSHLSADEFKAMLQNITSALPGIAFQLAVETVSPLLGSITKWAKSFESVLTNARKGSCELATSLVASAANATGFDSARACESLAQQMGLASDADSAANMCRRDAPGILGSARTSGDPNLRAQVPFTGNLVWAALKRIPTLDDQTRQIVMSLTGTVVYYPPEEGREPLPVAPTIRSVRDLLHGEPAGASGQIAVKLLRCDSFDECLVVSEQDAVHQGLVARVETLMRNIVQSIRGRHRIDEASYAREIALVNTTSLPLWRMLSIGTSNPASPIVDVLIDSYKELVAADYAFTFLTQFANAGLVALQSSYNLTPDQVKEIATFRANVHSLTEGLRQERQTLHTQVNSMTSVASDLERLERNLRSSMSAHVLDMLGHSYPVLR